MGLLAVMPKLHLVPLLRTCPRRPWRRDTPLSAVCPSSERATVPLLRLQSRRLNTIGKIAPITSLLKGQLIFQSNAHLQLPPSIGLLDGTSAVNAPHTYSLAGLKLQSNCALHNARAGALNKPTCSSSRESHTNLKRLLAHPAAEHCHKSRIF